MTGISAGVSPSGLGLEHGKCGFVNGPFAATDVKRLARHQGCDSYWAGHAPVLIVEQRELFVVETMDRLGQYDGPSTDSVLKPVSGPIWINGVQPGDTLEIEIVDIALPFAYGWILTTGRGALSNKVPPLLKRRVELREDCVVFSESIKVPLRPMISRVGVAPLNGPLPSLSKGVYGGAMGNREVTKGAKVYLPVFHEGAMLAVGDGHAAQGDGEATASAVECAVDVVLRAAVAKDVHVTRPVVLTPEMVMTTGDGPTLEEATRVALEAMAQLMFDRLGLDATDAAMLISTACDVRACVVAYPPYAVAVGVPTSILSL